MTSKPSNFGTIPIHASASDNINAPTDAKQQTGFGLGENPQSDEFNWLQNLFHSFLAHINTNGLPRWDASTTYENNAICLSAAGVLFQSQQDNTGNDPDADDGSNWQPVLSSLPSATTTQSGIVELATSAEASAGTDTQRAVTPKGMSDALNSLGITYDMPFMAGIDSEGQGVDLVNGQEYGRLTLRRDVTFQPGAGDIGIAPIGSDITLDVLLNDVSIYATTKPSIAAGTSVVVPGTLTTTQGDNGDVVRFIVVAGGSTTPGQLLTFTQGAIQR